MKKHSRSLLGYFSMLVGMLLLVFAAYMSSESGISAATKGVAVVVSAGGGGVLTFGVARRLLASSED